MAERTREFLDYCSEINRSGVVKVKPVPAAVKSKTDFNEAAADIAKGIHKTSNLLSKLTNLIKRQGLFDDPTEEINGMIFRIKQDLDELNTKCDTAQAFIDQKKTIFSNDVNQSSKHNVSVVSHLKSDLMVATKDFKTVLEMRQNKMKNSRDRKEELAGKGFLSPTRILDEAAKVNRANQQKQQQQQSKQSSESGVSNGNVTTSSNVVTKRHSSALASPYASPYGNQPYDIHNSHMNGGGESGNAYMPQSAEHAQQTQQLLLAPINDQYYDQRGQAVTEVEKTIGELGTLFQRLSVMIQQQGEMVERIDEDIENTLETSNRAQDVLRKAYEAASSNKMLFMKVGGIIAVFLLLFIMFLL